MFCVREASIISTLDTDEKSLQLALQPSVVKRALKYAVVVGIILILINHGDALLKGEVTHARLFKMALTVLVPYVVSTLSSVGALREQRHSSGDANRRQDAGNCPPVQTD